MKILTISGNLLTETNTETLMGSNLRYVDLRRANLRGADLRGAILRDAILRDAILRDANLQGANFQGADLRRSNLQDANLPHFQICPMQGDFIAYKATIEGIVKLLITAKAKRTSSLVGRKCRAEFAKVIALPRGITQAHSKHDENFVYKKGEIIKPENYDDDIRIECSHGIHFFVTRKEAEEWL